MPEVIVTGQRGSATATLPPSRYDVRLTATNAAGSDSETKTAYVKAGATPGTPRVIVTGARAVAVAAARPGIRPFVGVRALAIASGQAGAVAVTTPNATVVGVRAIARTGSGQGWGKRWGINWGGSAGHVLITSGNTTTITGVRAAATATAQAGSPRVLLPGTQAVGTAGGRLYAIRLTATNTSGSDSETKTGYVLARSLIAGTPLITITSPRAAATATAQPAGATESLLGVRAAATSSAQPGSPLVTVTGVRATATATGQPGTVTLNNLSEIILAGVRADATATARPNEVQILVGGQASATATATAGALSNAFPGDRAFATATGLGGSPRVIVTGGQGMASANTAGVVYVVQGVRALATATATPGAFAYDTFLHGVRALATATALPGDPAMALPIITRRTGALTGRGRRLVRVSDGRTTASRTR